MNIKKLKFGTQLKRFILLLFIISVVTVPKKMGLKSVPSSTSKMELKSDPSSAAKMELKSVQDPLILELVSILVPHFSNFFAKVASEKEGRVFGGWGRGWTGESAEQEKRCPYLYLFYS